jgi:hypothetical protein
MPNISKLAAEQQKTKCRTSANSLPNSRKPTAEHQLTRCRTADNQMPNSSQLAAVQSSQPAVEEQPI